MLADEEMEQIVEDSRYFFVEGARMVVRLLWLPFYLVARVFRRTD